MDREPIRISVSDLKRFYYCEFYGQFRKTFKKDLREAEDMLEGSINGVEAHKKIPDIKNSIRTSNDLPPPPLMIEEYEKTITTRKDTPPFDIRQVDKDNLTVVHEKSIDAPMMCGGKNYNIYGSPDTVIFSESVPLLITEFKFKTKPRYIGCLDSFETIQPRAYSLILDRNHYDISALHYTIVKATMGCQGCENLIKPSNRFIEAGIKGYSCKCGDNGTKNELVATTNRYNRRQTKRAIRYALPRIAGFIPAQPVSADESGKCYNCTISQSCTYSHKPISQTDN